MTGPQGCLDSAAGQNGGGLAHFVPLRFKGLLAFLGLIVYVVFLAGYVLHQKDRMLGEFTELERILKIDDSLTQMKSATFHAILAVNDMLASEQPGKLRGIEFDFSLLHSSHAAMAMLFPDGALDLAALNMAFAAAREYPSRENLIRLNNRLHGVLAQLVAVGEQVRAREQAMSAGYRQRSDAVTFYAMTVAVVGLMLYGAVIAWFFSRLARDLKTLQHRATAVVRGHRGAPLSVTRNDEAGQLMLSVNCMAAELDERERELAIERQRYLHQEKMAAVGALAAGVAHEIGNPIAAISGVAQAMKAVQAGKETCRGEDLCRPGLILEQTERIARITREISEFASPRPVERQLLDLNGLVRSTCSLMRYDQRFRKLDLTLALDNQLPAVNAIGDQLIQVVMNLLINAADAFQGLTRARAEVTVKTFLRGGEVVLTVRDNGAGMDADTLRRAFDAFFTTKPPGRGTGIGLAMCKSIVEGHSGRMEVDSQPGVGTEVRVILPGAA